MKRDFKCHGKAVRVYLATYSCNCALDVLEEERFPEHNKKIKLAGFVILKIGLSGEKGFD